MFSSLNFQLGSTHCVGFFRYVKRKGVNYSFDSKKIPKYENYFQIIMKFQTQKAHFIESYTEFTTVRKEETVGQYSFFFVIVNFIEIFYNKYVKCLNMIRDFNSTLRTECYIYCYFSSDRNTFVLFLSKNLYTWIPAKF